RTFAPGETVFEVGAPSAPAWFVLEGGLEIVQQDGLHREAAVIKLGAGQFSGELRQLAGHAPIVSARAGPRGCTALPFDGVHLRALVIGSAELGEIVMRAFVLRRAGLIEEG